MKSRRFLFATLFSNDLGLIARTLPIALELSRRGHRVAFCNPAGAPGKVLAEAGIENLLPRHPLFYLEMSGRLDFGGLWRVIRSGQARRDFGGVGRFLVRYGLAIPTRFPPRTPEVRNLDHFAALCGLLNRRFTRCICDAMSGVITEWQADVVVDAWNLLAVIAARALGRPVVTIIQADMHPLAQGFIWWRPPAAEIPSPVPIINEVLADQGLKPIAKMAELAVGDLTLVVGTPATDPLPAEADVKHIGAVLLDKPSTVLPEWIDQLGRGRPLVWAYSGNPRYGPIGSWADSEVILPACCRALADLDVQVVLTSGHHGLGRSQKQLPPNFSYAPFLPGLAMAKRADLLVHHGGYGSCQTGLVAGTPAVAIPTYSERESNARRLAGLGAGAFVLPQGHGRRRQVPVDEFRQTVRRVLAEPTYAVRAWQLSGDLRDFGGPAYAADLIEGFAP